jgi:hypothetical protein
MMHYVRQMGFTLFGASHLAILCSVPKRKAVRRKSRKP